VVSWIPISFQLTVRLLLFFFSLLDCLIMFYNCASNFIYLSTVTSIMRTVFIYLTTVALLSWEQSSNFFCVALVPVARSLTSFFYLSFYFFALLWWHWISRISEACLFDKKVIGFLVVGLQHFPANITLSASFNFISNGSSVFQVCFF
jgi:hypothetical protein